MPNNSPDNPCYGKYYEIKEKLIKELETSAKDHGWELDVNTVISLLFSWGILDQETVYKFVEGLTPWQGKGPTKI
jgi:hypothetical protein